MACRRRLTSPSHAGAVSLVGADVVAATAPLDQPFRRALDRRMGGDGTESARNDGRNLSLRSA